MSKKLIFIVATLLIISGIAVLAYVYNNFQRDANTLVVDQSNFDDQAILEEISNTPTEETAPVNVPSGLPIGTTQATPSPIKSGQFGRYDPVHYAEGTASIYQTADGPVLKLEGFKTSNGPDLFVYLATANDIPSISAQRGEEVSLGKLKQLEGDQVYKLPADYGRYNSVVIWCRAFDVNFSTAVLNSI